MTVTELLRADLQLIRDLVPDGSRVLDLGCGDGALLAHLREEKDCFVRGIELTGEGVVASLGRGLSVVQADLDEGLDGYSDDSFDIVVLSQTLQVVRRPAFVVREMLRVGRQGIVSFPNFGHWRVRGYLAFRGRMPVSRSIPYTWYETPNIHHTTLKDFREFVVANGGEVERELPLRVADGRAARPARVLPNLTADTVVAVLSRGPSRTERQGTHQRAS